MEFKTTINALCYTKGKCPTYVFLETQFSYPISVPFQGRLVLGKVHVFRLKFADMRKVNTQVGLQCTVLRQAVCSV